MYSYVKKYAAACCLVVSLALTASSPYAQDSEEFSVKAAYLYNFTKFIEWPGEWATVRRTSIDICVVGDSDMMHTRGVFKQASTAKLAINLVEENNVKNIATHCHIAFISESRSSGLAEILGALKGQPVLTVSDIDRFAEQGGMIGFVLMDNKVKLTVSPKLVTAAGLRVDAQLLEIALKVIDR